MAGVEREFGRAREIMKWHSLLPPPTRAVSRPNSLPLPFRTPATQAKFFPINKKKLGTLFFVHFFTVVLHDYNVKLRNFLGTLFFEEMLNVFLLTFFFAAAHFHLGTWQLAFPLFLTAALKFLCFSSNEIGLLWFFLTL